MANNNAVQQDGLESALPTSGVLCSSCRRAFVGAYASLKRWEEDQLTARKSRSPELVELAANFASLENSAADGCDFCRHVRRGLLHTRPYLQGRNEAISIRYEQEYHYREHGQLVIQVDFKYYNGALFINLRPPLDEPGGSPPIKIQCKSRPDS